jgi:hypothetical protein
MIYTLLKILISALLITLISIMAKRHSMIGAILASIPIVSVLAMMWLYIDTGNAQNIALLSKNIFWLVLPSLVLFITLPIFIQWQWNFYIALFGSILLTIIAYFLMLLFLKKLGVS